MNNFLKKSMLASSLLAGVLGISSQALAHVPAGGVVIDFEDSAAPGFDPMAAAVAPAFGGFYREDGVLHSAIGFGRGPGAAASIGIIDSNTSHIHGDNEGGSRVSELAADAGGGFFQLVDRDAFALTGLDAAKLELNLRDGGDSTMTFRGYTSADFSSWYDLTIGENNGNPLDVNGGNFLTETGLNINGTHIHLDYIAEFQNIYLFEYFFDNPGRALDPANDSNTGLLIFKLDNVEIGAAVSAVPAPAAAYLFGSAMLGLFGVGRKQGNRVAA